MLRRLRACGQWIALTGLYGAVAILLAYPLSLSPSQRVMSIAPDTDLFMWTLAWDTHALGSMPPWRVFDANIYFPERLTLAYSENLLGSSVIAAPVIWLTGNLVLAMNLVSLVSAVLCGLGMFLLARRIGLGVPGAVVSGLVFAFSPPRFLRLDQLHLSTLQWIPFALASLHAYLDTAERRHLWFMTACFSLQALTSGHGAVFALIALAGLTLWHGAHSRRALRESGWTTLARVLQDFGWQGALLLVPAAACVVPYLVVQREMGLTRTLDDWAVPASSFLASPSHAHTMLLSWLPDAHINETAGAYLFPGTVALALAVLGMVLPVSVPAASPALHQPASAQPTHLRTFYLLLTLAGLWLAAPPPIGLWPLVYWLPGFNFIRAPSRFALLALAGLAVLAGIGVDGMARRLRRRGPMAMFVGALLVADFAASPLGVEEFRVDIPGVDRWLATQPGPIVVAEAPLPDSRDLNRRERRQTLFMLHSTAHWWKTVHGYSGLRPPLHDELYRQLLRFPDEESLSSLERLGVTHIVVHADLYEPDEWPVIDEKLATFGDRLRLVHEEAPGRVYAVVRSLGGSKARQST